MASSSFAQSPPTAATTAPTKTPLNATPPTSVIYNHHPYNHTHSHLLSTANASGSSANSSANGSTKPYYYHQMMTNSSNSSSASSSTSSSSSGSVSMAKMRLQQQQQQQQQQQPTPQYQQTASVTLINGSVHYPNNHHHYNQHYITTSSQNNHAQNGASYISQQQQSYSPHHYPPQSASTPTNSQQIRVIKTINHSINQTNVNSNSGGSNSPKTLLDSIIRCQTTKLNRFVLNPSTAPAPPPHVVSITSAPMTTINNSSSSKLERNYSYIEAMKDTPPAGSTGLVVSNKPIRSGLLQTTKLLPSSSSSPCSSSSSSSSSSSTIEQATLTQVTQQPLLHQAQLNDSASDSHNNTTTSISDVEIPIEIPIEIKLNTTSTSANNKAVPVPPQPPATNLSKSRSQSSLINLFKTTFSPFQIRKWRSKSRDKLLFSSSSSSSSSVKTATNLGVNKTVLAAAAETKPFSNSSCSSSTSSTSDTSSSSPTSSSSSVAPPNLVSSTTKTKPPSISHLVTTIKNPNNNMTTNGNSNKTSLPVNHHHQHHHHHNHNHQHISRTSQTTSPRNTATTTTTTTLTATIVSNHPTQYKVRAHHRPNVGEEMTVALVTSPSNATTNTSTTKPPLMPTSPTKTVQTTTTTTTAASPTINRSPPNLLFQSASATAVPSTTSTATPNNERQLSYLKLTCLLNGYDDPTVCLQQQPTPQQPSTATATRTIRLNSTNHNSMRPQKPLTFAPGVQTTVQTNASNGEFLKSSKAMLSTDERYYDIKLKYLRQQQLQNQENTAVRSPTVGALVLNPKKKQSSPPPPIQATKQEPTTTTTTTTSFSLKVSVNDVSATNSSIDSIPTSIVTPTTNNNSNQPIDHSLEVLPPERIIAGCKPSNNTTTTTIEATEKPAIKEEEKEEPKCKEAEEEEKEKVVIEAIKDEDEKKENQVEVEVISETKTKPEEAEKPKPIEETETAVENKPEENKEEKQNDDQIATITTTTTIQDGNYYIKLHDQSCVEINVLCKEYEKYVDENDEQNRVQNEEVQGQIQAAIGKGQLLINQKLKQFKGLCLKNISEKTAEMSELKEGEFVTRDEDLAGFWDLVSIQVDDIKSMFDKLSTLRSTGWKIEAPVKKPSTKKPISTTKADVKPMNGMKQTAASKARAEAAKQRLLEAKKLAAAKQQQPTE